MYLVHHPMVADVAAAVLALRFRDRLRPVWVTEGELRRGVPWLPRGRATGAGRRAGA